jgi:hypothetical protein
MHRDTAATHLNAADDVGTGGATPLNAADGVETAPRRI